ncbi:peptidase inhibitor family I36 protein [Streptomyces sp. NPDC001262]|uniref:peptidase inhibitor family I36 protein n=1 Tax=Streptomyces sp. NPDC001262 TaxID=3364552 RepID=UPI0036BF2C5C
MGATAERLAAELRALHQEAGRPSYRRLVGRARGERPPEKLSLTTLSHWFSGQTIPSDPRAFRYLVGLLQEDAERRRSAATVRDWRWWEQLRQEALAERQGERAIKGTPGTDQSEGTAPDRESGPRPRLRPGFLRWCLAAVTALALFGAGFLTARVDGAEARGSAAPPAQTWGTQPIGADPPTIVGTDKVAHTADALPGPYRWFVAHDVSGADACPDGWACFFQNPNFNAQASGWEILVQDDEKTYDLAGQYNKAISSWINRTSVCIAWHELPHAEGSSWHGMSPGERRAALGAADKKAQSIHTLTDAAAFTPGSHP